MTSQGMRGRGIRLLIILGLVLLVGAAGLLVVTRLQSHPITVDQVPPASAPSSAPLSSAPPSSPRPSRTPSPSTRPSAKPTRTATAHPTPSKSARPKLAVGVPVHLRIPAIKVDAKVVPVRTQAGGVLWPPYPTRAGWWADGAKPGARTGSALIVGHTVHTGGGVFDHLPSVHRSDRVSVRTTNGVIRYRITMVQVIAKKGFAAQAPSLFSQSVKGRLVLVTCTGWTGTEYLQNVIVTAVPAS